MSSSNRGSGSSEWASSHHSSFSKPLIPKTNPSGDSPATAPAPASPSSETVEEPAEAPPEEPTEAPPEPPTEEPAEEPARESEDERPPAASTGSSDGPPFGSLFVPVLPTFPCKMTRWMDKYRYWKTARQLKKGKWATLFVMLYPGNWRDTPELQSDLKHNVALGIGWNEPFKPEHIFQADCFLDKLTEEEARAMAEEDRIRAKRAKKELARQMRKYEERMAEEMEMEIISREEGLEVICEEESEDTWEEDWESLEGEESQDEREEDKEDDESICLWAPTGKALETGDRYRCRLRFEHRIHGKEIPSAAKPLSRIAVARVKGFTLGRIMELLLSVPINSADGGNAGWRWIFYALRRLREDISLGRLTNTPGGPFPDPPSATAPPPVISLLVDPQPCYFEICPQLMALEQVTIAGRLAAWKNFLQDEGRIADEYQRRKMKPPKRNINFGLRRG